MTYTGQVIADNPTAYWRLDETSGTTITDSVGGVVLTSTGSPTYSVPSPTGAGISFGGTSSFSKTTPGATFAWTLGTDFSVEFMFKRNAIDVSTRAIIACRTTTATDRQFGIFNLTGNQILFDVGGTNNRWSTGVNITDTYWHHMVLKHRGLDGHREFWIDGRARVTTTQSPTTADATAGILTIGSGAGSVPIDGCLDEVAIYNGTYLSDARIIAHWMELVNNQTKNFMLAQF